MKVLTKVFGLALAVAGAGLVSSCTSNEGPEMNLDGNQSKTVDFIKAPEISIWSGSQTLYGTRADGNEEGETLVNVEVPHEVEINLAINDTHEHEGESINDLVTKLSIHVRNGHDVDVVIPVPVEYVVPVDDMAVVLSHQNLDEVWKKDGNSVRYEFPDELGTVTLTVDYQADGIHVTTNGITPEIINYCYATYGDGVNFEVYNYYNMVEVDAYPDVLPLEREKLEEFADASQVKFLVQEDAELPVKYVNAFMTEYGVDEACVDHVVTIVDEQNDKYDAKVVGPHRNGSDFNHIYNKTVAAEEEQEQVEE